LINDLFPFDERVFFSVVVDRLLLESDTIINCAAVGERSQIIDHFICFGFQAKGLKVGEINGSSRTTRSFRTC